MVVGNYSRDKSSGRKIWGLVFFRHKKCPFGHWFLLRWGTRVGPLSLRNAKVPLVPIVKKYTIIEAYKSNCGCRTSPPPSPSKEREVFVFPCWSVYHESV